MNQQEGGGDLGHRADHDPDSEGGSQRRERERREIMKGKEKERREGQTEPEAHERGTGGAHDPLQMLMRRRTQVPKKSRGNGDGDP